MAGGWLVVGWWMVGGGLVEGWLLVVGGRGWRGAFWYMRGLWASAAWRALVWLFTR